jgi:UDP-glucose 4-epimerase
VFPTPEDAPFPAQTSLYGASKLAGEGLVAAYCEGFGFEGHVFRFVSILGERYTHGHVLDFYKQLLDHPGGLKVLGDGTQRKSYLYVQDCLAAMLHVMNAGVAAKARHHVEVFNLGTDEYVQVNDSIRFICGALGLKPSLEYSGGDRGWVGDNPFIFLDTKKIRATGWRPQVSIEQGILRTLAWLQKNPCVRVIAAPLNSPVHSWLAWPKPFPGSGMFFKSSFWIAFTRGARPSRFRPAGHAAA